jgi:hypothetical protein
LGDWLLHAFWVLLAPVVLLWNHELFFLFGLARRKVGGVRERVLEQRLGVIEGPVLFKYRRLIIVLLFNA